MSALKTKFLKYIDSVTNEEHLYEVIPPAPTDTERGGIIASPKTDLETAEAKLGEDGKLYVNASVQIPADWNQNDETAQDYVKNRTHWAETEENEIVSTTSFEGQQYLCDANINAFVIGETYSVEFDDVLYEGVVCEEARGLPAIGATNQDIANDYPFVVGINGGEAMIMAKDNTQHTIRVYCVAENIHKLDEKYLPEHTHSWNNLEDKPFYISQEEETITEVAEIMPETTLEFEERYYVEDGSIEFSLEIGQFYTVTWNGVTYENLECSAVEGIPAIGTSDFSFTDYPFIIASGISVGDPMIVFMTIDSATSHTISVSGMVIEHIPEEMYMESKFVKHFQSNWDENDETKLSYIKNRPFHNEIKKMVIVPQLEYDFTLVPMCPIDYFEIKSGNTYFVNFDGKEYECVGFGYDVEAYIGGEAYGFGIMCYTDTKECMFFVMEPGVHTFEISENKETIVINKKYMPAFQSDWNCSDKSNSSYIKNKPFYHESGYEDIVPETTVYIYGYYNFYIEDKFITGKTYKVTFDDKEYECIAWQSNDAILLGNGDIYGGIDENTGNVGGNGEPFSFDSYDDGECYINIDGESEHTFKIETYVERFKKIDDKFQHQADWNELEDSKASFILNKPFGEYISSENSEVIFDSTVEVERDYDDIYVSYAYNNKSILSLFEGEIYEVTFKEEVYTNLECYLDEDMFPTIGSLEKYPFYISYIPESDTTYLEFSGDGMSDGEVAIKIVKLKKGVKKIDKKYLPEDIMSKDGIILKDVVNGYEYVIQMQNGQLVSFCRTDSITISTMPNKTEYIEGEVFDPSGMIVTANVSDGSTKEIINYTYPDSEIKLNSTSVTITYIEGGIKLETEVPITVTSLEPMLIDFEYTKKTDGTYTLDEWKGTLNGEPSTEILIPNYNIINI